MSIDPDQLRIVRYPAPCLRSPAEPVGEVDDTVRAVARRMVDLMHEAEGIGLAAPQVNLPWRLFVADVWAPEEERAARDEDGLPWFTDGPLVCINPVLSEPSRDLVPLDEGCLSIPGIAGEVRRPSEITLTATDLDGNRFSLRARDLLARCFQHENDHLDGVLIIDRFTYRARLRNQKAIKQMEEGGRFL
ncbi:MAG: peptide deformylase [Phycisphaerales bacterium]|nr:peptide deformylase [Phycisphaerales bacterium]